MAAGGNKLFEAYGDIKVNLDSLKSGLDKAESMVKSTAAKIAAVAVGFGATWSLGEIVKMADDLSKASNYAGLIFGKFANTIVSNSDRISTHFGASRKELVRGAADIGTVFRTIGDSPELAAKRTNALVPAIASLARLRDVDLSSALEYTERGLEGQTRGLRNLGINLNETQIQIQAMRMGFVRINGEFNEAQLTLARYALIVKLAGSAQEAMSGKELSLSAKISVAWANIRHALEDVGTALLPIAHRFVDNINWIARSVSEWVAKHKTDMDYLVSSFNWAIDQIRDAAVRFSTMMAEYFGAKGVNFTSLTSSLKTASIIIRGIFEDVGIYANIAALKIVEFSMKFQATFDWLKTVILNFTESFRSYWETGVIGSITAGIDYLYKFFKFIQANLIEIGDVIGANLAGGVPLPAGAAAAAFNKPVNLPQVLPLDLSLRNLGKDIDALKDELEKNQKARTKEMEQVGKPFVGPPKPEGLGEIPKGGRAIAFPPMVQKPAGAEFVGAAELWKRIQIGVLSSGMDLQKQQLAWTERTALATEELVRKANAGPQTAVAAP